MEWIADPSIWAGLVTLVVIELVLGIDNLVFIAILAEKLPPAQYGGALLIVLGVLLSQWRGISRNALAQKPTV